MGIMTNEEIKEIMGYAIYRSHFETLENLMGEETDEM